MLKRIGIVLTLALSIAANVSAQQIGVQLVSAQSTNSDCVSTANSCATFQLPNNPAVTLQISGAFSGTLTFEATSDGKNWLSVAMLTLADGVTQSTTTSSAGQFSLNNSGIVGLRARATTWSSGTATVVATRGQGNLNRPGTGGGSGLNQLTGDVAAGPGTGSQVATIQANAVTGAKMAQIATLTFLANPTGGTTNPAATTLSAFLDPSVASTPGTLLARGASLWGALAITSGGVIYGSGTNTAASSGVLTANAPVIGGGAGAAPTVGTRSGNTTTFATTSGTLVAGDCPKFDASFNIIDSGGVCGGGAPGGVANDVQINGGGGVFTADSTNLVHNSSTHVFGSNTINVKAGGYFDLMTATKTTNYTAGAFDGFIPVDASGGAVTITLPTPVGIQGRKYIVKKVDSTTNAVTVATAAGNIDGTSTQTLLCQYSAVEPESDGTNWKIGATGSCPFADPGVDTLIYYKNSTKNLATVTLSSAFSFTSGTLDLATAGVSLTKLATIANNTVLGNTSGSTAAPSALTNIPIPTPLIYIVGASQAGTANISCSLPSSGQASAVNAATTVPPVGVASFSGSASNEIHCSFITPLDWGSGTALDIILYWRAASTSGSVVWSVATLFVGAGTVLNTAYNTASTVTTAAQGTTLQVQTSTITGITVTGTTAIGANKIGFLKILRNGGVGSDNMTGTSELIGFIATIRRSPTIGG